MKRKIMMILMAVTVSLTVVSCDKIKSLTANTNKTPEYVDPITLFPPEVQALAISEFGRFKKYDAKNRGNGTDGIYKNAEQYNIKIYRYADERYKKYYDERLNVVDMNWDVELRVWKMTSPENPQKRLQEIEADSKKKAPKLKQCNPEYEAENETTDAMPDEIIKRVKHPNSSDILIVRYGLFITGNCVSKDNRNHAINAYWADGNYLMIAASNYRYKPELSVVDELPMIEDFVADYVAAAGKTAK